MPITVIKTEGDGDDMKIVGRETYASTKEWEDAYEARLTRWARVKRWAGRHVAHPIRDAYWWAQHRINPRHRYHVIKTELRPNFYDADILMEAAIIRLFVEFIEVERPWEVWSDEKELRKSYEGSGYEDRIQDWIRIKELYHEVKDIDLMNPSWEDCSDFEWGEPSEKTLGRVDRHKRLRDEFTNKLIEIVKLRGYYWT